MDPMPGFFFGSANNPAPHEVLRSLMGAWYRDSELQGNMNMPTPMLEGKRGAAQGWRCCKQRICKKGVGQNAGIETTKVKRIRSLLKLGLTFLAQYHCWLVSVGFRR